MLALLFNYAREQAVFEWKAKIAFLTSIFVPNLLIHPLLGCRSLFRRLFKENEFIVLIHDLVNDLDILMLVIFFLFTGSQLHKVNHLLELILLSKM
jgi:hypothetical protein